MQENTLLLDEVQIEDPRTQDGEAYFETHSPLRHFRGNYGVPRTDGTLVFKAFFNTTSEEARSLEWLHKAYISELESHIPLIKTNVIRKCGLVYATQPLITFPTVEKVFQSHLDSESKQIIFRDCLQQALNFVNNSDKVVGIDGKPENWVWTGSQAVYIDTFPPFIIESTNIFAQTFRYRAFEKQFAARPNSTYFRNPAKIIRRFWMKAEKFDTHTDYRTSAINVAIEEGLPQSLVSRLEILR